jgi:hypothetical protein
VRDAKAQGWRFSAIVAGVARSAPFTMRGAPEGASDDGAVAAADAK